MVEVEPTHFSEKNEDANPDPYEKSAILLLS
jgi:hypothetical protein